MNKEPETYEELIRMKRCVELTKYYNVTKEELEQIYNFLAANPNGQVDGKKMNLSLVVGNNVAGAVTIAARCISSAIDGVIMSNTMFRVIPHYTPSSGGGYSGGSSSNNNNNNNNNR